MPDHGVDLLLVGGTGFVGRAIRRLATGRIVATHHASPPSDDGRWRRLDLRDGGADAAALVEELRPAAVVNAAYVASGPALDAVTAEAPGAIAAACARSGSRFVHLSTDVVFDGTTDRPYRETDAPSPIHPYGRAKARAEELVAAADPAAVIVRTSLLYGDETDPGHQAALVIDPTVRFFTDEFRNPLPVASLASACLELAVRPDIGGPLHVAGADTVDRFVFARLLAPLVGVDPATVVGAPGPGGDRPRNCPLDSSLARSLLDTSLPGVGEVLGSS